MPPRMRWTLAVLLLLPAVNYAATQAFVNALAIDGIAWRTLASLNGAVILVVLLAYVRLAWLARPRA